MKGSALPQEELSEGSLDTSMKNRTTKKCLNCGIEFSVFNCRAFRENCCSSVCKKEYREKQNKKSKEVRRRFCLVCGNEFFLRLVQIREGCGKYCSLKCYGHQEKAQNSQKNTLKTFQLLLKNHPNLNNQ